MAASVSKANAMYLSRFGVKRYKCLGEIDIPLTPIHVLIGQNDAGKTSLLEAMAAYCSSAELDLRSIFPRPWNGRELVLHQSESADVELWGEWDSVSVHTDSTTSAVRYGFAVDFPLQGSRCQTRGEWIEVHGERREILPKGQYDETAIRRWKLGFSAPPVIRPEPELHMIVDALKPAHHYVLEAKAMATPAAIDPHRRFRMDYDGFGLPTVLDDILGYDAESFIRLRREFCARYPQFTRVRIESENALRRTIDQSGVPVADRASGKGIYFETSDGGTIRAQHASDGAVLLLGFLALAHLPDPPNLLLIEEPENGIYPKRLEEVISILKQLVHRRDGLPFPQIILTTHSPYVLSYFEPEEVTFLSREPGRPDAPVRARPLRDAPNIRERLAGGEFFLGELWYNLSEEELFGEP